MKKITLGLTDDEDLFLLGLSAILEDTGVFTIELQASNGQELLTTIAEKDTIPDVLIIDVRMKVMDGIETSKHLLEKYPDCKIIILSTYYQDAFLGYMIKIGICAFLPKNIAPDKLMKAICHVHEKGLYLTDKNATAIQQQLIKKERFKSPALQQDIVLTKREKQILELICDQYTSPEIAEKLFISFRTVEGHRNNLMSKIGAKNTVGLVIFALLNNLVDVNKKLMEYTLSDFNT